MKNIKELRDELLTTYDQLKADPRRVLQARELGNIAGKIICTAKAQLEYAALRKETPVIAFLEDAKEKQGK